MVWTKRSLRSPIRYAAGPLVGQPGYSREPRVDIGRRFVKRFRQKMCACGLIQLDTSQRMTAVPRIPTPSMKAYSAATVRHVRGLSGGAFSEPGQSLYRSHIRIDRATREAQTTGAIAMMRTAETAELRGTRNVASKDTAASTRQRTST